MPNYRRKFIKGGTWFFTINLLDRKSNLLIEHFDDFIKALKSIKQNHPFRLDALTVLPEHFHMIMSLPETEADFSTRIRLIKGQFSRQIPNKDHNKSLSRTIRGERTIWQRRFWEHQIRNQEDYNRHIEYCYINPVKHGHVSRVKDWQYSTFHRDVQRGLFDDNWAGDVSFDDGFGERQG